MDMKRVKMQFCAVCSCEYNNGTSMVKMFRFPKDIEQNRLWKSALQIPENNYSPGLVCINHFKKEDIEGVKTPKLRKGAIPTICHVFKSRTIEEFQTFQTVITFDENDENHKIGLNGLNLTEMPEMAGSAGLSSIDEEHEKHIAKIGNQRYQREIPPGGDFVDVMVMDLSTVGAVSNNVTNVNCITKNLIFFTFFNVFNRLVRLNRSNRVQL